MDDPVSRNGDVPVEGSVDRNSIERITQTELEEATRRGHVVAEDIKREGWSPAPQWRRWMRVEVARLINAVATGKCACDLKKLRRALDKRADAMRAIEAMPCGFDHRNAEARKPAEEEISPVVRLMVRKPLEVAARLFVGPPDPSLEADRAWLMGEPAPNQQRSRHRVPSRDPNVSPLLTPSRDGTGVSAITPTAPTRFRLDQFLNKHRLRSSSPKVPKDPSKVRFMVADIETTGLSDADRIVEISIIEMRGSTETGRTFHRYINPLIPIPQDAVDIHGITDKMVASQQTFAQMAPNACCGRAARSSSM